MELEQKPKQANFMISVEVCIPFIRLTYDYSLVTVRFKSYGG